MSKRAPRPHLHEHEGSAAMELLLRRGAVSLPPTSRCSLSPDGRHIAVVSGSSLRVLVCSAAADGAAPWAEAGRAALADPDAAPGGGGGGGGGGAPVWLELGGEGGGAVVLRAAAGGGLLGNSSAADGVWDALSADGGAAGLPRGAAPGAALVARGLAPGAAVLLRGGELLQLRVAAGEVRQVGEAVPLPTLAVAAAASAAHLFYLDEAQVLHALSLADGSAVGRVDCSGLGPGGWSSLAVCGDGARVALSNGTATVGLLDLDAMGPAAVRLPIAAPPAGEPAPPADLRTLVAGHTERAFSAAPGERGRLHWHERRVDAPGEGSRRPSPPGRLGFGTCTRRGAAADRQGQAVVELPFAATAASLRLTSSALLACGDALTAGAAFELSAVAAPRLASRAWPADVMAPLHAVNRTWYLLCERGLVSLSADCAREELVNDLLLFGDEARASELSQLNGWASNSLSALTLGLQYSQMDVIEKSLSQLTGEQRRLGADMLLGKAETLAGVKSSETGCAQRLLHLSVQFVIGLVRAEAEELGQADPAPAMPDNPLSLLLSQLRGHQTRVLGQVAVSDTAGSRTPTTTYSQVTAAMECHFESQRAQMHSTQPLARVVCDSLLTQKVSFALAHMRHIHPGMQPSELVARYVCVANTIIYDAICEDRLSVAVKLIQSLGGDTNATLENMLLCTSRQSVRARCRQIVEASNAQPRAHHLIEEGMQFSKKTLDALEALDLLEETYHSPSWLAHHNRLSASSLLAHSQRAVPPVQRAATIKTAGQGSLRRLRFLSSAAPETSGDEGTQTPHTPSVCTVGELDDLGPVEDSTAGATATASGTSVSESRHAASTLEILTIQKIARHKTFDAAAAVSALPASAGYAHFRLKWVAAWDAHTLDLVFAGASLPREIGAVSAFMFHSYRYAIRESAEAVSGLSADECDLLLTQCASQLLRKYLDRGSRSRTAFAAPLSLRRVACRGMANADQELLLTSELSDASLLPILAQYLLRHPPPADLAAKFHVSSSWVAALVRSQCGADIRLLSDDCARALDIELGENCLRRNMDLAMAQWALGSPGQRWAREAFWNAVNIHAVDVEHTGHWDQQVSNCELHILGPADITMASLLQRVVCISAPQPMTSLEAFAQPAAEWKSCLAVPHGRALLVWFNSYCAAYAPGAPSAASDGTAQMDMAAACAAELLGQDVPAQDASTQNPRLLQMLDSGDWLGMLGAAERARISCDGVARLLESHSDQQLQDHIGVILGKLRPFNAVLCPDTFRLLFACQSLPHNTLLQVAIQQRRPLLALVANEMGLAPDAESLLAWVVSHPSNPGGGAAYDGSQALPTAAVLDAIRQEGEALLGSHLSILQEAFRIFSPDDALGPVLAALRLFGQRRFADAASELLRFDAKADSIADPAWVTAMAVAMVDGTRHGAMELNHFKLLQIAAAANVGDFVRLFEQAKVLRSARISLEHVDLSPAELVALLFRHGHHAEAKRLSRKTVEDSASLTLLEADQMIADYTRHREWEIKNGWRQLWQRCDSLFVNRGLSADKAHLFFVKHAKLSADRPSRERLLILSLGHKWLGKQGPPAGTVLEDLEREIWVLTVDVESQGQLSESEFYTSPVDDEHSVSHNTLNVEPQANRQLAQSPASVIPQSPSLLMEMLSPSSSSPRTERAAATPAQQSSVEQVIGKCIHLGYVAEAERIASHFKHASTDVELARAAIAVAQSSLTGAQLDEHTSLILEDKFPSVDVSASGPLELLDMIAHSCSDSTRRFALRLLVSYRVARMLGIQFSDVASSEPVALLRQLLMAADDARLAHEFLLFYPHESLTDSAIADALCFSFREKLQQKTSAAQTTELEFKAMIQLCKDPTSIGESALRLFSETADLAIALQIELLILAHSAYQSACSMDGADRVLLSINSVVPKAVASQEWHLLIRLLTTVRDRKQAERLFTVLLEEELFEKLLGHAQTENLELRVALSSYLERNRPEDLEKLSLIYIRFNMWRAVGELILSEANNLSNKLRFQQKRFAGFGAHIAALELVSKTYVEAAWYFDREKCFNSFRHCMVHAALATLQRSAPNINLIDADRPQALNLMCDAERFEDAKLVGLAYQVTEGGWSTVLYLQAVLGGKSDLFEYYRRCFGSSESTLLNIARLHSAPSPPPPLRMKMSLREDRYAKWLETFAEHM